MNQIYATRTVRTPLPFQTTGEEIANSIIHGLGILMAVGGLVILVLRSRGFIGGTASGSLAVVSYVIYSSMLILMFLFSTLYHAIQHDGAKRVFQVFDHSAIYLLIAGTYTPYCLLGLGGPLGWTYFGIEWGLAIIGIVLYTVKRSAMKKVEVLVYVLMGWAIVFGFNPLRNSIPRVSVYLLVAGGVLYTLGTFWYRLRHRRVSHVIWHVHVAGGAACHWLSLWFMS